jgi:hypothetical protein
LKDDGIATTTHFFLFPRTGCCCPEPLPKSLAAFGLLILPPTRALSPCDLSKICLTFFDPLAPGAFATSPCLSPQRSRFSPCEVMLPRSLVWSLNPPKKGSIDGFSFSSLELTQTWNSHLFSKIRENSNQRRRSFPLENFPERTCPARPSHRWRKSFIISVDFASRSLPESESDQELSESHPQRAHCSFFMPT